MAAPSITSNVEIASRPFLIRKLVITSGNTATALTHSGPAMPPDMYFAVNASTNPTATDVALYTPTSTTITMDCEDDGNDTIHVFLIWFDQAAGGIS